MKTGNPLCNQLIESKRKTLAVFIQRRDDQAAKGNEMAAQLARRRIEVLNDEILMLVDPENTNQGEDI